MTIARLAAILLVLVVLTGDLVSAKKATVANDEYDAGIDSGYAGTDSGSDGYGGYDGYGGGDGYGGYGENGESHHGYLDDVETFLKLRDTLIEAANNAVGFVQLASLNEFNEEAMLFPYDFPGPVKLYVREVEKVPPSYKYEYLYKKPERPNKAG